MLRASRQTAFAGEKLQRREFSGFALAETAYPANLKMPRHAHDLAYITLVLQGGYDEIAGKQARNCHPATLVFHPPDEAHAIEFHQQPVRIFRVETKPHWLAHIRQHTAILDKQSVFAGGAAAQLAMRLYQESHATDAAAALTLEGLLLEIISTATRQTAQRETRLPYWLQQVRDCLHAQMTAPPTLETLAQQAQVHPVYLAREFRRHFHCTVGEYVRRLRIEHACQQITTSQQSLADIAQTAGFYDQSHFSRTFKRITGMTPAGFRAAAQKG